MTPRFSIQGGLGLMLLAYALAVHGQERSAGEPDETAGETAGPVLLELLEFIGEFTTDDGEWVDPAVLLEVDDRELTGGTPVLGAAGGGEGGVAGEEQPAAPVENCIATRCK